MAKFITVDTGRHPSQGDVSINVDHIVSIRRTNPGDGTDQSATIYVTGNAEYSKIRTSLTPQEVQDLPVWEFG